MDSVRLAPTEPRHDQGIGLGRCSTPLAGTLGVTSPRCCRWPATREFESSPDQIRSAPCARGSTARRARPVRGGCAGFSEHRGAGLSGLTEGPAEVACTNFYLNDEEWAVLCALPAALLRKRRHLINRDGLAIAVDEHEDGSLVAEIDDGDAPSHFVPDWLDVVSDVSEDEAWTGVRLAR